MVISDYTSFMGEVTSNIRFMRINYAAMFFISILVMFRLPTNHLQLKVIKKNLSKNQLAHFINEYKHISFWHSFYIIFDFWNSEIIEKRTLQKPQSPPAAKNNLSAEALQAMYELNHIQKTKTECPKKETKIL